MSAETPRRSSRSMPDRGVQAAASPGLIHAHSIMANRARDVIVKGILWAALLAVAATVVPVSAQAIADSYRLDIAQQPLDGALKNLAEQTGLQIARFSDLPDG